MRLLITGAAGTLAQAICQGLDAIATQFILIDRNAPALERLSQSLQTPSIPLCLDLNDIPALKAALNALTLEGLDGCCHVASLPPEHTPYDRLDADVFQTMFNVHVQAPSVINQWAYPYLKQSPQATILHFSSVHTQQPLAHATAFRTTKAALEMLSQQTALDWGPEGIHVHTLLPGGIASTMLDASGHHFGYTPQTYHTAMSRVQKIGDAHDVVAVVTFLLSDQARYLNGLVIPIDGGYHRT